MRFLLGGSVLVNCLLVTWLLFLGHDEPRHPRSYPQDKPAPVSIHLPNQRSDTNRQSETGELTNEDSVEVPLSVAKLLFPSNVFSDTFAINRSVITGLHLSDDEIAIVERSARVAFDQIRSIESESARDIEEINGDGVIVVLPHEEKKERIRRDFRNSLIPVIGDQRAFQFEELISNDGRFGDASRPMEIYLESDDDGNFSLRVTREDSEGRRTTTHLPFGRMGVGRIDEEAERFSHLLDLERWQSFFANEKTN